MTTKRDLGPLLRGLIPQLRQLPMPVLVALLLVGGLIYVVVTASKQDQPGDRQRPAPQASAEGYLFCFWNVENLFDDVNDRRNRTDEKYDNQFADDPKLRETKLGNLSKVLLAMNDGKGPDILAVAEVESERALELLTDRLNQDLGEKAAPYRALPFKPVAVGRHIAPGIISRLPAVRDRTLKLGKSKHRILEGRIEVDDHQLVVIVSHWKSRVPSPGEVDEGQGESGATSRAEYADVIYGRFLEMYNKNEAVDLLLCGDFNDEPDDPSVMKHLRGIKDRNALTTGMEPNLFNLALGKAPDLFGTEFYKNKWNLFDQILVSPGLLDDKGWTCLADTFRTERKGMLNKRGRPWRFDEDYEGHRSYDEKFSGEHGFADHFPVTVRLTIHN